jgi:hypothetical protein
MVKCAIAARARRSFAVDGTYDCGVGCSLVRCSLVYLTFTTSPCLWSQKPDRVSLNTHKGMSQAQPGQLTSAVLPLKFAAVQNQACKDLEEFLQTKMRLEADFYAKLEQEAKRCGDALDAHMRTLAAIKEEEAKEEGVWKVDSHHTPLTRTGTRVTLFRSQKAPEPEHVDGMEVVLEEKGGEDDEPEPKLEEVRGERKRSESKGEMLQQTYDYASPQKVIGVCKEFLEIYEHLAASEEDALVDLCDDIKQLRSRRTKCEAVISVRSQQYSKLLADLSSRRQALDIVAEERTRLKRELDTTQFEFQTKLKEGKVLSSTKGGLAVKALAAKLESLNQKWTDACMLAADGEAKYKDLQLSNMGVVRTITTCCCCCCCCWFCVFNFLTLATHACTLTHTHTHTVRDDQGHVRRGREHSQQGAQAGDAGNAGA